jgi:hypothetical protein
MIGLAPIAQFSIKELAMRHSILLASLLLLIAPSPWLRAQIKLPVYDGDAGTLQKVRFEEATVASDFQHGRLVRVSMNEAGDSIQGTLVRADRKNGRVYVRTEPGSPPRAFDIKQIKKIEKGVIRDVAFGGDVVRPEIQQLVIYNGVKKTVAYTAPTLSPGEIERLNELALAENESAQIEYLSGTEARVLENALALQAAQRKAQELANELTWRQLGQFPYPYRLLPGGAYFGAVQSGTGAEALAYPWPGNPSLGTSPLLVQVGPVPNVSIDPGSRTAARQKLLVAQGFGVYEQGGLIAVIAQDTTK